MLRLIVTFIKWSAKIVLISFLTICAIFIFAQTDYGKNGLIKFAGHFLNKKYNTKIEATGFTGTVPFNIKIGHLALQDKSGVWLDIQNLTFRFSPLYLFKGKLLITEFKADSIELNHIPDVNKSEDTNRPFSWANFLYHIGLKHLDISRLSLGKEILGRPATYFITAKITDGENNTESSLSLNADRTDGIKGSVIVKAEIKGAEPDLIIDARVDEPENGLLAALLGVKSPFLLTLNGEGPLNNWSGKLSVSADQLADINAAVGLQSVENLHISLAGTAILYSGLCPKILTELSGPEISFKIQSHLNGKYNLVLDNANLESDKASVKLNGAMDMKKMTSEGSLNLGIKDISPFGQLIHNECSGRLALEADFKGLVSSPRLNLRLSIEGLKTDVIQSEGFRTESTIEWLAEKGSPHPVLHIAGKGNIKRLYAPSLSDNFPEKDISWDMDISGPNNGIFKIKNIRLTGDVLMADISGVYNYRLNDGTFDALLSANSLERYSSFLKVILPPGIGMKSEFHAEVSKNLITSKFSGMFSAKSDSNDYLSKLVAPEIKYSGNLEISELKVLNVSNFRINSDKANLTASGSYDLQNKLIHGLFNLQTDSLAGFSFLFKKNIGGSAKIEASIDGLVDKLSLKAKTSVKGLSFGETNIQDISASFSLTGKPLKNEGEISLQINQLGYNIKGRAALKLDNSTIALNNILFESAGLNVSGHLSYDLKNVLAEGELHGKCKDISVIASLLGKEIRGSADIDARFNPSKGMNLVNVNLQAKDISGKFGKAAGLDMKLKLFGDFKSPDITVAGSLRGFEKSNLLLKTIDLTATGNPGNLLFTLKGTGRAVYDLKIETAGKISISSSEQSLTFDWLRGEYEDIPVNLTKPLNIIRSEKIIELKPMEVNLSGGKLSASGTLSDESLNLNLNVNGIPASLLQLAGVSELDGTATGSITLSGMLQSPEARVQLILSGLRLHDPQYANLPPFKLTLMSELKSNKLHTDLSLGSSMGNPFILEMDIPLTLSFSPFTWSFPEDGLLKGRMSGKIDLENIASLTGLYNQIITGSLDMNFDLGGTIKSPVVTGHAVLDNGTYENMSIGTEIKNIKADISSDASRFILNQISGEQGKDGVVTGKGWIEFAPAKDFPFEVSLNIKKVVVIRGESSTVTVTGKPSLSGTFKDNTLKGKLTVDRGDFSIPERLPAGITVLEVKEINGPEQEQPQKKSAKKSIMKLDLFIESEGQVFLTGRGLNSEWKGNLTLKGSVREPIITGRLSVLRGNYNFLGKRFTLTNGLIDLDGRYPMSPNMEVTGNAVASKITAIINLSGDVRKPQITLTSEPIMPSDEILSQLLFGQEVSKISPLQAIELANALNTMLGKGNYDIVGKTKKILGVDQLEVKQSAENATESSVSVGKYLSDSVYIEVEKGLGAQSSKASVTWEVTPNISIDTDIGENLSSGTSTGTSTGVGINWKWDY